NELEDPLFSEMNKKADYIGQRVVPPVEHYTLFTLQDMYENEKEFRKDKKNYKSRCDLFKIGTDKPQYIVNSVVSSMTRLNLEPENVMVQLPQGFEEEHKKQLDRLVKNAPGIKFMIIDTQGLKGKRNRAKYRRMIYTMMLLARKLGGEKTKSEENLRIIDLLKYFVSSFLPDMTNKNALIAEYINGIMLNEAINIIKLVLSYKHMEHHKMPNRNITAKTLMSA
ncbi:MAG: hypothetical protein ABH869_06105, partial [Candidatus Omnitrophota bacterium]